MSALGSSVINKSSKKFGPKQAPIRRAPTSTQTSARPSVDRQLHSQTPQPQASQQNATLLPVQAPSTSSANLATSRPSSVASQGGAQNNATFAANASPSLEISIPKPGANQHASLARSVKENVAVVLQRLSPPPIRHVMPATHEPTVTTQASSQLRDSAPNSRQLSPRDDRPTSTPTPQPSNSPQRASSREQATEQRAAKRRRISTSATPHESQAPDSATLGQNAPPSTTSEPMLNAASGPAAPSQIYSQPIRESIEPLNAGRAKKPRISKQAKAKKQAIEARASEIVADAVGERPSKGKKVRKPRSSRQARTDDAQQPVDDVTTEAVGGGVTKKKSRSKRKKRESTPEGAEDVQINTSEVTMSDLTGNVRTGRRSSRDKEIQLMQEADKDKKKLARKKALEGIVEEAHPPQDEAPTETSQERLERLARERRRSPSYDRAVPNTIIVNGQIQLDESTLVIDRHAQAARIREEEAEDPIDETELSRRINSSSWLKVDKSGGWNEALTDQFYDGLRMFGTDFYMISKMFPGRTRHSVKLKFNKEEKLNGWKIEATLKGEKIPVDIDEFSKVSNTVFTDPKDLDREMDEDKQRIEKEEALAKAALDEAEQERADQAAREAAADGEESSSKENEAGGENSGHISMKTKQRRRKKARAAAKGKHKALEKSSAGGAMSKGVTS
ncbi:MAG: hypothetical protein Q9195_001634 [Heterodermia aff. obscurata]